MNIDELLDTTQFFRDYYLNARANSILVMDITGIIIHVNGSFTEHFGYSNADIAGTHFSKLFNEQDNELGKPQKELNTVLVQGQAYDENYVVKKSGLETWCTGEGMLVTTPAGEKFIVKDIINLEERKAFLGFVRETVGVLDRIFLSRSEIAMLVLDSSLKVEKANPAFIHLFGLTLPPPPGTRLGSIKHSFWNTSEIKQELGNILVHHEPLRHKRFIIDAYSGQPKTIYIDSLIVDGPATNRKIYLMIDE